MKKIILIILILLTPILSAETTIDTVHFEDYYFNGSTSTQLGQPRAQILEQSDGWVWFLQEIDWVWGAPNEDWQLLITDDLTNTGPSNGDDVFVVGHDLHGASVDNLHNHAHISLYDDDTVLYCGRHSTNGSYTFFWSIAFNQSDSTFDEIAVDSTFLNNVDSDAAGGAVARIGDSDSIMVVGYNDGTGMPQFSVISDDFGATWGDSSLIFNFSGITRTQLVGNDYTVFCYIDSAGIGHIKSWKYDRSNAVWIREQDPIDNTVTGLSRAYNGTFVNSGATQIVIAEDDPDVAGDMDLYYSIKDTGDASWNRKSFTLTSGYSGTPLTMVGAHVAYLESSDRTVLLTSEYREGVDDDDSLFIYAYTLRWSDTTWQNRTQVSSETGGLDDGGYFFASGYTFPGDSMYITYDNNRGETITKLTFTDVAPENSGQRSKRIRSFSHLLDLYEWSQMSEWSVDSRSFEYSADRDWSQLEDFMKTKEQRNLIHQLEVEQK